MYKIAGTVSHTGVRHAGSYFLYCILVAVKITEAGIIVLQLEIPVETVCEVMVFAQANQKRVILNPVSARELPNEIFSGLFLLAPNRMEAEMLSGAEDQSIEAAVRFATRAAAIAVSGKSVQASVPYRREMGEERGE
ncbi:PfkB family carbohydrate kinase [Agriterribacter sp.]|uniref:PfkB family carbohydrate kinase n=1 Tax=Agriterribacter sp. TaxID=2821509 RepID=UPI002C8F2A5D|nr:PfkB family carbohydrate kinase [Agriterribacter sp.]HTN06809.1 PfkB family carbohydrate kinase [Agriterribacter sp.]